MSRIGSSNPGSGHPHHGAPGFGLEISMPKKTSACPKVDTLWFSWLQKPPVIHHRYGKWPIDVPIKMVIFHSRTDWPFSARLVGLSLKKLSQEGAKYCFNGWLFPFIPPNMILHDTTRF